jgi:uncharacterized protein YjbI with pentapeptide repeats
VTQLAERLWLRTERSMGLGELQAEVARALEELVPEPVDPAVATHLIGSGSLLVRDDEGRFSFVHQSVLEWLVANAEATAVQAGKEPPGSSRGEMSELMVDFFTALAGVVAARAWAEATLEREDATAAAKQNALRVLERSAAGALESAEAARPLALPGQDLRAQDLSTFDLRHADLRGTDLRGQELTGKDLTGADLRKASLVGARLDGAVLIGARLDGADLSRASLLGAELTGLASFEGARLRFAKLLGARAEPRLLEACDLFGAARPADAVVAAFDGARSEANTVAFSPNGELMASGHADGGVRLRDAASGNELRRLDGHSDSVSSVAFSPDGARLASASYDHSVRLWDAASGNQLRRLDGHSHYVLSVAFSPDGARLASASYDHSVRLWDAASGVVLATLVHAAEGWVAFTPEGRYRLGGNVSGSFWHVAALCRFEPGELDRVRPDLRLQSDEPLVAGSRARYR